MKKTNENLVILITLFAISIVIANVTGARTITTGLHIGPIELALSGGAITYAVTFLCTDIIGEIWGKATAQRVVKYAQTDGTDNHTNCSPHRRPEYCGAA